MTTIRNKYLQPAVVEICLDTSGLPLMAESTELIEIDEDKPVDIERQDQILGSYTPGLTIFRAVFRPKLILFVQHERIIADVRLPVNGLG